MRVRVRVRVARYLGTCFNPSTKEAYVVSDYVAGCSLLEIQMSSQIRCWWC